MASETPVLRDDNGLPIRIGTTQTGELGINVTSGMHSILVCLSGERLDAFMEALHREAMPGQAAAVARDA